jgi:AhpD family alkylhydroperoxidase
MCNKENLAKLQEMDSLAPELMKSFWAFDKTTLADGAIPIKYKELIAVAVALTTKCPYCIDNRSGSARNAGATNSWFTPDAAALVLSFSPIQSAQAAPRVNRGMLDLGQFSHTATLLKPQQTDGEKP